MYILVFIYSKGDDGMFLIKVVVVITLYDVSYDEFIEALQYSNAVFGGIRNKGFITLAVKYETSLSF